MLSNIYRQHIERISYLKEKQGYFNELLLNISIRFILEKKKKELNSLANHLTNIVLDRLNEE